MVYNNNLGIPARIGSEDYNNIYKLLKCIFWEEIKSRIPIISGIERFKQEKLLEIEERRLNSLLQIIQNQQEKLDKDKIDTNFIYTEEFARNVFNIFEKSRIDYREEKLQYYANILLNCSTTNFSKQFYKEGIIENISKYSIEHIIVLQKIYERHIKKNNDSSVDIEDSDNLIDGFNKTNWDICVYTLTSDGFLSRGFFGGYFITSYGIKCIDLIMDN